jgi:HK97 family phage major capsid protein
MKLSELFESRKALTAERDSILAQDSLTVEIEARGHEVANELATVEAEIRSAQMRERFASSSAVEIIAKRDMELGREERDTKKYRDQFVGWLKGGQAPEVRALSTATTPATAAGTIMVPAVYETEILKYLAANSTMINLADYKSGVTGYPSLRYNTQTSANYGATLATSGTGSWIAEGGTAVTNDMALAEVLLPPKLCSPTTQVSQTLLRQANFDVEAEVMMDLQSKLSKNLEFGFIGGTGTNMPTGIFDPASTTCQVRTGASSATNTNTRAQKVTAATSSSTVILDNFTQMRYNLLPAAYWNSPSCAWIIPQDVYAAVAATTVNNVPLFVPSADAGITGAAPFTLMGLPVYVTQYVPVNVATAGTTKNVMAVVGDIRESFSIRQWAGIGMIRDDITLATTGQVKYTALAFANANVTRGDALVQLRVGNIA